ncbi:MAG TPA: hypothetical protein VMT61_12840 [Candidatus Binataceae bacterium]|nr:hypothetical protein [Candidatus Binataceae bacterium]
MRPRSSSHIAITGCLTVLAVIAAACGGDSGGGGGGGGGTGGIRPTRTPTATATASASPSATPTASPTPITGACLPASSLSVLVQGTNVSSYVPKGSWKFGTTGVSVIQIEPSPTPGTLIPTGNIVNSCASDSVTGQTVCTANNTDVYLLSGSKLTQTLTSSGLGTLSFSGGLCTNCGVTFNPATDQALIAIAVSSGVGGYQFLDLSGAKPTFEAPFATESVLGTISEEIMIDPTRNLILSASEINDYELVKMTPGTPPSYEFFENQVSTQGDELDASAEDCTTGIALATDESTGNLYLADLSRATFTPGSPGTWSAPSQLQNFPEFTGLFTGTCGIAVAPPSHLGVVTGEFGGSLIGAIQLPSSTSGSAPAVTDWIACNLPNEPNGNSFQTGYDPHTVTAYVSPNTGDSMALIADEGPSYVAVVDLTRMLDPKTVSRTGTGHSCSGGTLPGAVATYVPVP